MLRFKEWDKTTMCSVTLQHCFADVTDFDHPVRQPVMQTFQHPNPRFGWSRFLRKDVKLRKLVKTTSGLEAMLQVHEQFHASGLAHHRLVDVQRLGNKGRCQAAAICLLFVLLAATHNGLQTCFQQLLCQELRRELPFAWLLGFHNGFHLCNLHRHLHGSARKAFMLLEHSLPLVVRYLPDILCCNDRKCARHWQEHSPPACFLLFPIFFWKVTFRPQMHDII